ncbi:MAG: hypothetical protein ACKVZJ_12525 [Phycisphaerales bacterium]
MNTSQNARLRSIADTRSNRIARVLAVAVMALTATLTGCEEASTVSRGFIDNGGPQAIGLAPVVAIRKTYDTDGPRVAFDNQSSKTLEVRWWIARVDAGEPEGFTDLRTGQHLGFISNPGKKVARHTERKPWPTGTVDAVVRVEVRERLTDGTTSEPTWMELPRPGPYLLRVREIDGQLAFDRPRDDREVVVLPNDLMPVGRNGEFPVYRERVSMSE